MRTEGLPSDRVLARAVMRAWDAGDLEAVRVLRAALLQHRARVFQACASCPHHGLCRASTPANARCLGYGCPLERRQDDA